MSQLRNRLLITLIVLAASVVIPRGAAHAFPALSTISEHEEPSLKPSGGFSGEPDVGQTSPANLGRTQSCSAAVGTVGDVSLNEVVRLSVWLWKARLGMTGF